MIVACPSCSTRYRHESAGAPPSVLAECSRCEEQFPVRQARRSYVLLPPGSSAARVAVGAEARPADPVARPRPAAASPIPAGAGVSDVVKPQTVAEECEMPQAAPAHSALLEFMVAVIPPSVGASVAYYFALRDQLDPVAWSALGGAAGFLLGWGCLLWIRRKG